MTSETRLIVKVGSRVLCDDEGRLDAVIMHSLAGQIAQLQDSGIQVLLVSSGAVAAGRHVLQQRQDTITNPVARQQVLAAAGQVRLMETWQTAFNDCGLQTAQVLISKRDFQTRQHYLHTRACLEGLLSVGVVPIVNENDVVSVTELMFTDNDELAGLLAGMVGAEFLALLSSVPGVLDNNGNTITQWDEKTHAAEALVRCGTSTLGRGGMHSKLAVARKTAALGTHVIIADGRQAGILKQLVEPNHGQNEEAPGTRFTGLGQTTAAKRWLAGMDDHALGAVTVNEGAQAALMAHDFLASLLPVGIVKLDGDFQRGDVIQVRNRDGRVLGCGRAQYDADEARAVIGQHDQKPLIHYDYLYLTHDD